MIKNVKMTLVIESFSFICFFILFFRLNFRPDSNYLSPTVYARYQEYMSKRMFAICKQANSIAITKLRLI